MFQVVRRVLTISLLWGLPLSAVFAQSTGEVTGVVTDPTGAGVPAAKLELSDLEHNTTIRGETSTAGLFRFTGLNPGKYSLAAAAQGFAEIRLKEIVVEVNRITRADLQMALAQASSTVQVSAEAADLDVESGTKGDVLNIERAKDLPLESRNPLELAALTPGVFDYIAPTTGADSATRQGADGTAVTARYMLNGGAYSSSGGWSDVVVDGISVTSQREGVIQALPGADTLQEFRVQSGGMGPEVGRTVGGVMNYVTRSGTNQIHGNLFWDNRNTATTARRALPAVGNKPINNYNQFGGTVGGPVWLPHVYNGRNRTFFFLGYDGSRWLRNNPTLDTVPTADMRAGNFSELSTPIYDPQSSSNPAQRTPFAGNVIPSSRFNAIGMAMVDAFPLPTRPGLTGNYDGNFRVLTPVDDYTARVDHSISDRQRLMGRVTWVSSLNNQLDDLGVNDGSTETSHIPSRNVTLNYSYTITPQLLYTTAGGFTWFDRTSHDPTGNTVGAGSFNFSVNPQPPVEYENIRPIVSWDIYRTLGGSTVEDQLVKTWQWNQQLAWIRGRQTIRFGTDLRWFIVGGTLTVDAPNGSFSFSPLQTSLGTTSTGSSVASALLGMPNTASFGQPPELSVRKTAPSFYIADDIRVAPFLTLNLGVRFDYEGGLVEAQNRIGYFDSSAINSVVGIPGVYRYAGVNGTPDSIANTKFSVSPRVGFAWSPKAVPGFVVRGAFGAYSAPVPMIGAYAAAPGYEALLSYVKATITAPAVILQPSYTLPTASGPLGDSAYLGQSVSEVLNRQLYPPRVYEWNFGIQKELPGHVVWEGLYTGNRGTHLLASYNLDTPFESIIQHAIDLTNSTGNSTAAISYLNQLVPNSLVGLVPGTLGAATVALSRALTPYPQFSSLSPMMNDKDSIYHALQTTFQKQLGSNITFLAAYSYSKLLSDFINIQNPYNLHDSRGLDPFDRTHTISTSTVFDLPFGKGKAFFHSGWESRVFGGFHLNHILRVQSGAPISITESSNSLGLSGGRPDFAGDPAAASEAVRGQVAANGNVIWINPTSYQLVSGRFGTAPAADSRLRGPGFWELDLALGRDFHLWENTILRFNAQAFNAFNHTNLLGVDTNRNSGTFGQISAVGDPRIFQFGLELRF